MNRSVLPVFALTVALAFACAEEPPPIDRVQPNALPKSFFLGEDLQSADDDPEFWSQSTLIDVPWGAHQGGLFTSTYVHPTARLRWQITEDVLIGRAAYERVEGSDGRGVATGFETQDGVIVVAFPIEAHLDIANAYDPSTGERLNVVEENSVDRPWYARTYIRVDWSRNLNTEGYDFDTLSILGVLEGVEYEPLTYAIEHPHHEHAPVFDVEAGYFDVTTKAFARPQVVDVSHLGWGFDRVPACFLDYDSLNGSFPEGGCSPVELTVRHSFRRVEDHDYAPVEWDGWRAQAFGGFAFIERFGYARNYGMTDTLHHRFLARYPIWSRHHYYKEGDDGEDTPCYTPATTPLGRDPHRDEDNDGTEDECAAVTEATGVSGSQCDTFSQQCTLPFRARTPTTLPWYFTNGAEERFFEATADAAHQWDVALRVAVRSAQYGECVRTGEDADTCRARWPLYFGQQTDNSDAVALAMEMDDCRRGRTFADLEGDPAACRREIAALAEIRGYREGIVAIAEMPEMVVVCHSPVEWADPPACAPEALRLPQGVYARDCAGARADGDEALMEICAAARTARRGDLRYHQVNVISEPQAPSPWGIYSDAEDPLTGETVAASINVWSWYTDYWAQRLVDYVRFAAGELTASDVSEGEHIHAWSEAAEAAGGRGAYPGLSGAEVDGRIADLTGGALPGAEAFGAQASGQRGATLRRQLKGSVSQLGGVMAQAGVSGTASARVEARRAHARGTAFEAELLTPMMQAYYGTGGHDHASSAAPEQISPLRGGAPTLRADIGRQVRNGLARRGMCEISAVEAPVSIKGLGELLQAKFGHFNAEDSPEVQSARAERMVTYLARRAHRSVLMHEMGHSIGLRHNFVSSADALGYRPQYWQLRTNDDKVRRACTRLSETGADCVGPRYYDPVTPEESDNLIWMWQQSSVMDYPGEGTQELLGLGAYDFAATRMFYGDTATVYAEEKYRPGPYEEGFERGRALLEKLDDFGGIVGIRFSDGRDDYQHYSRIGAFWDLIRDCEPVEPNDFVPTRYDADEHGAWHPLLDGELVAPDGETYTRCRQPPVDYVPWTSLQVSEHLDPYLYYRSANPDGPSRQVDAHNRPRVPYGFASDDWADLGNVSVLSFDNGADAYEITHFLIAQQELFHVFDNYRRGRAWFSPRQAAEYTLGLYNTKIRDMAKGLALQKNYVRAWFAELGWNADEVWGPYASLYFADNVLASGMAFDHFARMLARPAIGEHCRPIYEGVFRSTADFAGCDLEEAQVVHVPNGAYGTPLGDYAYGGRLVENRLDRSRGGYELSYTLNSGSYYDKVFSALLMTESRDNFVSTSRQDYIDKRYRSVSLADLFPDGFRRWLANNLTTDDHIKGVRVAADERGQPVVDGDLYPTDSLGWTSWWGETPRACFPTAGTNVCARYEFAMDTLRMTQVDLSEAPEHVAVLDPQVGWEQQKFLIAWSLLHLPENERTAWLDQLRIWELGRDGDPGFAERIELHDPQGRVFVARTFGRETLFGKRVERGIAARIIEHANELLGQAYETVAIDPDGDGVALGYAVVRDADGEPIVRFDPTMTRPIVPSETEHHNPICNAESNAGCTCAANRACLKLETYLSVPTFLREALEAYGHMGPRSSTDSESAP